MEISYALLCDAANLSQEGSLNTLGAFSRLYTPDFPFVRAGMSLALQIMFEPDDVERERNMSVRLVDPDGFVVIDDLHVLGPVPLTEPGRRSFLPWIATFENVPHTTPGDYEFRILVDEKVLQVVSYEVVRY